MVNIDNLLKNITTLEYSEYNIISDSREDRLTNENYNILTFYLRYRKHIQLLNRILKENLHYLEDQLFVYHEDPKDAITISITYDIQNRIRNIKEEKEYWEELYSFRFKNMYRNMVAIASVIAFVILYKDRLLSFLPF